MPDQFEGLAIIDNQVKCCMGGVVAHIDMTPDDMRRFAVALALTADKLEGVESPPIAKFVANDFAGTA